MKSMKPTAWTLALCVLGSLLGPLAQAQDARIEQAQRMETALLSPGRPAEDKGRDAARKPIQSVQFLGIKTGHTVIDVIAVGGWFTEVLSAAVGPSGKVYAQNPQFFVSHRTSRRPRRRATTDSATCRQSTASSRPPVSSASGRCGHGAEPARCLRPGRRGGGRRVCERCLRRLEAGRGASA